MARREIDPRRIHGDSYATLEHLEALRADINDALRQISAQLATRPNPSPKSSSPDGALMAQIFQLQAEMRENARAENDRLRAELRAMAEAGSDPVDEIERAQRLVELLPQEKDETKDMVMGALGMLAEVMSRDTEGKEEPAPPAAPSHAGHVPEEHFRPLGSANSPDDPGPRFATVGGLDLELVED